MLSNKSDDKLSIASTIIGILFFLSLFIVYLLPNYITNYFKVIAIFFLLILLILYPKGSFDKEFVLLGLFILYQLGIMIFYNSSFEDFSKILLFIMIEVSIIFYFNAKDIKFIINCIIIGTVFFTLGIIFSNNIFSNQIINRSTIALINTTINANGINYVVIPSIALIYAKIYYGNKYRILYIFIALCIILIIVYSGSRTGILSLFFATIPYLIGIRKKISRRAMIISIIFILILFYLAYNYFEIAKRIFSVDSSGRIDLWKEVLVLSKNNLLFGNGFSFYKNNTIYNFGSYGSHNIYLDFLLSIGLFGLSLFILCLCLVIYKGRKNLIIYSLMLPLLITMMFESAINYHFMISLTLSIIINKFTEDNDVEKLFVKEEIYVF